MKHPKVYSGRGNCPQSQCQYCGSSKRLSAISTHSEWRVGPNTQRNGAGQARPKEEIWFQVSIEIPCCRIGLCFSDLTCLHIIPGCPRRQVPGCMARRPGSKRALVLEVTRWREARWVSLHLLPSLWRRHGRRDLLLLVAKQSNLWSQVPQGEGRCLNSRLRRLVKERCIKRQEQSLWRV